MWAALEWNQGGSSELRITRLRAHNLLKKIQMVRSWSGFWRRLRVALVLWLTPHARCAQNVGSYSMRLLPKEPHHCCLLYVPWLVPWLHFGSIFACSDFAAHWAPIGRHQP